MNPKYALLVSEHGLEPEILAVAREATEKVLALADRGVEVATVDHPLITTCTLSRTLVPSFPSFLVAANYGNGYTGINGGRIIDIVESHPVKSRMTNLPVILLKSQLRTPGGTSVFNYCVENKGVVISTHPFWIGMGVAEKSDIMRAMVIHCVGHLLGLVPAQDESYSGLAHCAGDCIMAEAGNSIDIWKSLRSRATRAEPFCPRCKQHLQQGDYFLRST